MGTSTLDLLNSTRRIEGKFKNLTNKLGQILIDSEIIELVKEPKIVEYPLAEAMPADNNSFLKIEVPVYRLDMTLIDGLVCELTWKSQSGLIAKNEKYTLYKLSNTGRERIFQIEVYPEGKMSHRTPESIIYGSHIHSPFGAKKVKKIITKLSKDEGDRLRWFKRFCRHINANINIVGDQRSLFPEFF